MATAAALTIASGLKFAGTGAAVAGTATGFAAKGVLLLIGSAIDTAALSALFPAEGAEGPRVAGQDFANPTEGANSQVGYGQRVRVPGHLSYATVIQEVRDDTHLSGKGGTGGEYTTFKAFRSVGVEFFNAELAGIENGIAQVLSVKAEGKEFFKQGGQSKITGDTTIAATVERGELYHPSAPLSSYWLVLTSSSQSLLKNFQSGARVEVSGFSTTLLNGTFTVLRATYRKATSEYELRCATFPTAAGLSEAAGNAITILQKSTTKQRYADIRFQLGTPDQVADPLLVEQEASNVGTAADLLAYRGRVMMWVEDLNLQDWGNRTPSFEAVLRINADGDDKTSTAIQRIATRAEGIGAADVDVSAVSGTLGGLKSPGIRQPRHDLHEVMLAQSVACRDDGTKLVFEDREDLAEIALDASGDDFACSVPGGRVPRPFKVTNPEAETVSRRLHLEFPDSQNSLQKGTRKSKQGGSPVRQMSTMVAQSAGAAQKMVDRLADSAHANEIEYEGTLHPKYLGRVYAGAVVTASGSMDRTHRFRIRELREGTNGVLEFKALAEDAEALNQAGEVDSSTLTGERDID